MACVAQRDGCAQDALARAQRVLRSLGWVDWVAVSPIVLLLLTLNGLIGWQ